MSFLAAILEAWKGLLGLLSSWAAAQKVAQTNNAEISQVEKDKRNDDFNKKILNDGGGT